MSLCDKLPVALSQSLTSLGMEPVIALRADLTLSGLYGEEWLVVTDSQLAVYAVDGGLPAQRFACPLADVRTPKLDSLIGGGALVAEVNGALVEMLRFTNACERSFSRAAKYLADVAAWHAKKAEGADPGPRPSSPLDTDPPKRCPTCDMPLSEGSQVCPACMDRRRVLLRLGQLVRPHWRYAAAVVLMIILSMFCNLVPPYLTMPLMDKVLAPAAATATTAERLRLLGLLVLGFLCARAAIQVSGVFQGRFMVVLGARLSFDLRTLVYERVQRQSLRFFHHYNTGAIMSRITQDTESLEHALIDVAPWFVVNILTLLGIGVVLLVMDWRLTLLLLLPVPVVLLVSRLAWSRLFGILNRFFHVRAKVQEFLNDSLSGVRVVKAFAREQQEIDRFQGHNTRLYNTTIAYEQVWSTFFPLLWFVLGVGEIIVWYIGGRAVVGGAMSLGTLVLFISYLGMFYGPLQFLSRIADFMSRSLASAGRVLEVIDADNDVKEAPDAAALPCVKGRVELRGVTFGYDAHKPVLRDISLDVAPGEMIGFVGHSGAGKSTLINLICRFYDPQVGAILVDGHDLRAVRQQDLRSQFGVVLQDTFLFNGSILDNIRYAKPAASFDEVLAAAHAASAHDFIVRKPDGYDTVVGERGQALSGGERQRIAIARAILHDPRILILDEATASVDTDTERMIQEAIARLVKGRTTFAIAHRLSTLRNANRLVVLKDGKLVETGTHDELMEKKGEFHRLVQMQQEMSRIKAVDR